MLLIKNAMNLLVADEIVAKYALGYADAAIAGGSCCCSYS